MDRFDGGRSHIQGPSGDSGDPCSFPGGAIQKAHFLLLLDFLAVKCGIPDFPILPIYIRLLLTLPSSRIRLWGLLHDKTPLEHQFPTALRAPKPPWTKQSFRSTITTSQLLWLLHSHLSKAFGSFRKLFASSLRKWVSLFTHLHGTLI